LCPHLDMFIIHLLLFAFAVLPHLLVKLLHIKPIKHFQYQYTVYIKYIRNNFKLECRKTLTQVIHYIKWRIIFEIFCMLLPSYMILYFFLYYCLLIYIVFLLDVNISRVSSFIKLFRLNNWTIQLLNSSILSDIRIISNRFNSWIHISIWCHVWRNKWFDFSSNV